MKRSSQASIPFTFTPPLGPFAVPAGVYSGVLQRVSTHQCEIDSRKTLIRFTYDVVGNESGPVKYQAVGEYYDDDAGHAALNKDLLAVFEQEEIDRLMGMQVEVDLAELVGSEVDFEVSTHVSSTEPAYSRIDGIYRAGDLIPRSISIPADREEKAAGNPKLDKPTLLHTPVSKTTEHVFKCSITGKEAGTVHLVEGEEEAEIMCLTPSREFHSVVEPSALPALRKTVRNGDLQSLSAFHVDFASFYCPKCQACFSDEHWKALQYSDSVGWQGPPRWVCPQGHEREIGD